jgi:hypothetical protein
MVPSESAFKELSNEWYVRFLCPALGDRSHHHYQSRILTLEKTKFEWNYKCTSKTKVVRSQNYQLRFVILIRHTSTIFISVSKSLVRIQKNTDQSNYSKCHKNRNRNQSNYSTYQRGPIETEQESWPGMFFRRSFIWFTIICLSSLAADSGNFILARSANIPADEPMNVELLGALTHVWAWLL